MHKGCCAYRFIPTLAVYTFRAYFMLVPRHQMLGDLIRMLRFVFNHALVPFAYLPCLRRLLRQKQRMHQRIWRDLLLVNSSALRS